MDERPKPGLDIFLAVWSRRKWLAIPVCAGVFAAAVSVLLFLPDIYRSSATVVIEGQQVPEEFVKPTVTSGVENRLQRINQEILSRSRLLALIDRFGLYTDLKKRVPLEKVIERMQGDIQLELKGVEQKGQGKATVAFAISFRGSDPQKVALVTNTLASFYIEENLKVRERQASGTAAFLQAQLEETKKKLDEQERLVSTFKKRYIGELPQQQEANLATLEHLNTQLRLNSENQARVSEQRAAMMNQLVEADAFGPNGGPDATGARIARLKQELAALRTRFSDKYPDVIQAESEIAALEAQLTPTKSGGEPKEGKAVPAGPYVLQLKKAIGELDAEIKALKAEDKGLRHSIAAYQQRVENAPQREQEFQALSRDYQTTKEMYASLMKRYEESRLAESMEQRQKGEQFRILDPAIASEQPFAPNRGRLILMGLILSLGLAVGTVMLAEYMDTSFHTVDDLRAFTRVPILVSIPCIVTEADLRRRRWQFRLGAASAILGMALIVGLSYLVAQGNEHLAWKLTGGRF